MSAEPFLSSEHDHGACVEAALHRAEAICARRGARLTALRRRVLEIVWSGHRPIGAYDVLDALTRDGRRAAPPTVYRALDFLLEQGLVHRLASLNAFVGCAQPGHRGQGQFLICRHCGSAAELRDPGISGAIEAAAADRGFETEAHTVEITGECPNCRRVSPP